ncbi:MAG: Spy/CpxP family protein refolding chaperone [Methylophilaceae bacterium]
MTQDVVQKTDNQITPGFLPKMLAVLAFAAIPSFVLAQEPYPVSPHDFDCKGFTELHEDLPPPFSGIQDGLPQPPYPGLQGGLPPPPYPGLQACLPPPPYHGQYGNLPPPGNKPDGLPPPLAHLGLTPAQLVKVTELLQAQAPVIQDKEKIAHKSLADIRHLAQADHWDKEKAKTLTEAHGKALSELVYLHAETESRVWAILTKAQRKRLLAQEDLHKFRLKHEILLTQIYLDLHFAP